MTCARRIGIIVNDLRGQNRAAEVNNFHLHNVNVVFGKKINRQITNHFLTSNLRSVWETSSLGVGALISLSLGQYNKASV